LIVERLKRDKEVEGLIVERLKRDKEVEGLSS